jgi:sulfur-carrier protein adenylyltransferase/sulfurtransferase
MSKQAFPYERYQRQILLNGFGEEGQKKLSKAGVLVVGAGGLGCPALQYLAAAGVGRIGIVDDDAVSLHNLHRQVLYTTNDVGLPKAETAAKRLREMNPGVTIEPLFFRLTTKNALGIINQYDIVLDGTDNFATRYMVNDACVLLGKPLVYGAISQFEGQVAVFNSGENSANYRDLFPQAPRPGSVLSCAEAGVLGVLPGIIGTMQATEVIKVMAGIGSPLKNQLFTYNALTNESFVFALAAKEQTVALLPKTKKEFENTDYEWLCGNSNEQVEEIEADAFSRLIRHNGVAFIDVREQGEEPAVAEFLHRQIPLSVLNENQETIKEDTVVLFCQSGKRSAEAARILSAHFGQAKKIYSLKGGITNWKANGKEA